MKLSWRDCHNYQGNKTRQKCLKCGKILYAKDDWKDNDPKCAVREELTLERLILDFFEDKRPNAYIYINPKPFSPIKVTAQDLLDGK